MIPELLDEPIDGRNVCVNGCFLALAARKYQHREECPHCGGRVEVRDG